MEILWDSDSYFLECGVFDEIQSEEVRLKADIDAIVEDIWSKYD